jgi:uncharacterized membrane protein
MRTTTDRGPLLTASILLGVGLGGFVDGILLHQILQWHHLVSVPYTPETVPNLQINTFWDGLFHAATWVATAVGLALLWRASRTPGVLWSNRAFVGSLALGWGLFNLVEGIVDHHLLGIHHVREDVANVLAWDLGFLAFGAILVAIGWAMIQSTRSAVPELERINAVDRREVFSRR